MALKTPTITKEQAKEELLRIVSLLGKTPTRRKKELLYSLFQEAFQGLR